MDDADLLGGDGRPVGIGSNARLAVFFSRGKKMVNRSCGLFLFLRLLLWGSSNFLRPKSGFMQGFIRQIFSFINIHHFIQNQIINNRGATFGFGFRCACLVQAHVVQHLCISHTP